MGVKQGFQNKGSRDQNVQKVLAVTTSTITLTNRHTEFLVTNRGTATACVVTLPVPATCKGKRIFFAIIADYAMRFVSTGKIVGLNNASVDAINFPTAGQLIGQHGYFLSDGTSWTVFSLYEPQTLPTSVAGATGTAGGPTGRTTATGGATSIATTGTGGAGGAIADTTGAGGTAAAAATASTGGAGGAYSLTTGDGGAASVAGSGTMVGGASGTIALATGTGGATGTSTGTNTGGASGAITLRSGTGGAAANTGTDTGGASGAVTVGSGTGGAGDTGGGSGVTTIITGAAGAGGSPTVGHIAFSPGASEKWRVTPAGVLNSLATVPANAASADGAVLATGGLAFTDVANAWIDDATQGSGTVTHYIGNQTITTSSDARLKKDIKDTEQDADAILKALRVVDFTWNDPTDRDSKYGKHSRGRYMGFIGQEMADVTPWAVNVPGEAQKCKTCKAGKDCKEHAGQYWFAEYHYIVPPLVKAYQEMAARVERLEKLLLKK